VEDPAIDLAVCASITSCYEDKVIPNDICFAGEVGLGGEIRAVNRIESRISEAEKLGFKGIFISKYNQKGLELSRMKIRVHAISKMSELFDNLFA
jgi:DNA repair protein RadA/Sms